MKAKSIVWSLKGLLRSLFCPSIKASLKWSALSWCGISTCLFSSFKMSVLYSDARETCLQLLRCSLVPVVFCSAVKLHDFNVDFWSVFSPAFSFSFPEPLNHMLGFWLKKPHQCHMQSEVGKWRQCVCFCSWSTNCTNQKRKQPTGDFELLEIFIWKQNLWVFSALPFLSWIH